MGVSIRLLALDSAVLTTLLDKMNRLSNKLFLNIAGIFVGTLATFQTVSCIVEPVDHGHHVVIRPADQGVTATEASLFDFTAPGADVSGWIDSSVSYEQFFAAPKGEELQVLALPLVEFKPYWRGMLQNDSQPLDTSSITSMGIQFYGGVYEEGKQSGPSTLEIDWIKASN